MVLCFQSLFIAGADTELTDEFRRTPLHIAVKLGYEAVVRLLICEGADINARIACRISNNHNPTYNYSGKSARVTVHLPPAKNFRRKYIVIIHHLRRI